MMLGLAYPAGALDFIVLGIGTIMLGSAIVMLIRRQFARDRSADAKGCCRACGDMLPTGRVGLCDDCQDDTVV